jgi:hypothetical protein
VKTRGVEKIAQRGTSRCVFRAKYLGGEVGLGVGGMCHVREHERCIQGFGGET